MPILTGAAQQAAAKATLAQRDEQGVKLRVGGKEFGGWKTARVTRGIESIAGSFSLTLSERWTNQKQPWPIREGDACTILIDGQTLITGYVDKRRLAYSATEHSIEVSGRDKTGDLVDCSAFLDKWEYLNISLLKLATKLCTPFNIPVSLQAGVKLPVPPRKTSISPGETSFNVLEQACRQAGVLPVSDGKGGVQLVQAGNSRATTSLIEGENILAASGEFDASERFEKYLALGQHQGDEYWFGEGVSKVQATAEDPNITRTERVLVLRPEGNVTTERARIRAQWEASTRAARGDVANVTVQGWTQGDGSLWPINALVRLKSPMIGIDGDMLISQVSFNVSDSEGTVTALTLKRPDAFTPLPKVVIDGLWKEIAKGV